MLHRSVPIITEAYPLGSPERLGKGKIRSHTTGSTGVSYQLRPKFASDRIYSRNAKRYLQILGVTCSRRRFSVCGGIDDSDERPATGNVHAIL